MTEAKPDLYETNEIEPPAPLPGRAVFPRWFYAHVPNRIAGGLTSTLLPLFVVQVLNGNMMSVGWLSSVTSLAGVPANILWGNLSDRTSRRLPFIFLGMLSFAATTIAMGFGGSVIFLAALSSLGSLLGTASGPASSALTIESVPSEQLPEAFGWLNQIMGVAYVGGMLIGMAWLEYLPPLLGNEPVMRGLFLFSGSLALLSPFMAAIWIKEPRQPLRVREFLPAFLGRMNLSVVERTPFHLPRNLHFYLQPQWLRHLRELVAGDLGKYYLYTLLMFLGVNLAFMPLPVYLSEVLGASNGQVFLISLVKSVVDTFFFVPMGRLLMRRRGIGLQAQAAFVRMFLFAILGGLALLRPGPVALLIVGAVQVLNGVTWAAISVSGPTAVAVLAPKGTEARAMGTYNAVMSAAGILGGPLTGFLVDRFGYGVSYGTAAFVMLLTALLMWSLKSEALRGAPDVPSRELIRRKRRTPSSAD
jgi:MFS family permease